MTSRRSLFRWTIGALAALPWWTPAPAAAQNLDRPWGEMPREAADKSTPPDRARGWDVPPSVDPDDAFLFAPRAVLFIPNLALKAVFLPVHGLAVLTDRYHLAQHTIDLLYNDARTAAILPLVSQQTGYGLSYGALAFHEDVLGNGEELSLRATFGGLYFQKYDLEFEGERVARTPLWLAHRLRYEVKPALLFFGYGDRPDGGARTGLSPREASVATRFREERFLAALDVGSITGQLGDGESGGMGHAALSALYNYRRFGPEDRSFDEPSIETVYDTRQIAGFNHSVHVVELGPHVIYDARDSAGIASEGFYFDAFATHTLPITPDAKYFHYGAQFATYFDLYGKSRILSFRFVLEAVLGREDDIPFSDLVKIGGPQRLRGYELDRFRDRVGAVATVEYRYPIHQLVSGELFFDAGRVGRDHSSIFSQDGLSDLRYGGGLGFVFHDEDETLFKLEVARGETLTFFFTTDPLEAFSRRDKRL